MWLNPAVICGYCSGFSVGIIVEQPPITVPAPSEGSIEHELLNCSILSSHSLVLPVTFSFRSYNIGFDVVVVHTSGDGVRLTVRGDLGVLPFSAESPDARNYIRSVIEIGEDLPYAEISLTRTQSIVMKGVMNFTVPPTPTTIAAATAVIVIASKPFVDLIGTLRDPIAKEALKPLRNSA